MSIKQDQSCGAGILPAGKQPGWLFYSVSIHNSFNSTFFILLPLGKPAELWATEFRLDPIGFSLSLLVEVLTVALTFWVYTQRRTRPIVLASAQSGHPNLIPKLALLHRKDSGASSQEGDSAPHQSSS
ncbi:MAG: hypothetical protein HC835_04900 [Oscillatoriales cyanobacterium RM2_1_1]|nr:hypothetical protein [Oscillatoriales cyanobacterium SM2_3_0]NJO45005.1 hypothetical protein [Oscillatoriales cyanobacterium RM2_1_1]